MRSRHDDWKELRSQLEKNDKIKGRGRRRDMKLKMKVLAVTETKSVSTVSLFSAGLIAEGQFAATGLYRRSNKIRVANA